MKTVIGMFKSVAEATKVKEALQSKGYEAGHIAIIDQDDSRDASSSATSDNGESFSEKVKDFFSGFSDHKDEHTEYSKSIGDGDALLAVSVPDNKASETAELLTKHGATGIQKDYSETRDDANTTGSKDKKDYADTKAVSGDQVIAVVQEDLVVGKREVDRGGVRIYSHMVEEPATADVTLRDERIVVERKAVDRAATSADFNTDDKSIELKATGEEAVVGKTSRVVEEVRVGKQASEHTEKINETVRHTEVDVEPVTATTTGNSGKSTY